jgi:steroid 5-alpha reductase family enzyme
VGILLAANAGAILVIMLLLWGLSIPLRDVSIVDIAWGAEFVVVAWLTFFWSGVGQQLQDWLLPVLTTLWGLRLAGYLLWRKWGEGEDRRYGAMRDRRGASFWLQSLYVVFLLQGLLLWIISLPLQVGVGASSAKGIVWQAFGAGLWLTGFLFESVGDWQLARFRRDRSNNGQVMDRGLWRYTRHPNYFGDFCVWWGLGLIALGRGAESWTLIGPAVMSVLLMRISGVSLLESSLRSSKPGYEEYARRTSTFFPWPPKSQ